MREISARRHVVRGHGGCSLTREAGFGGISVERMVRCDLTRAGVLCTIDTESVSTNGTRRALALDMKPDSGLQKLIVDELARDKQIGEETTIAVSVHRGVVTLDGVVRSYAEKHAVEDAAHRVSGVLDVASELRVEPSWQSRPTESEIAAGVRRALAANDSLPSGQIETTVTAGGHVTLRGIVRNLVERDMAEAAIRDLDGVQLVTNYIVVEGPAVSARMVRDAVQNALKRHVTRETLRFEIEVNDDTVVLSGSVDSLAERRVAVGAVKAMHGVKRIEDRLRVERPDSPTSAK